MPGSTTYEINTNRRNVTFSVRIIGKSKKQTRLSNTRISDQQELEEVVAVSF
jgi:hypothetical protein